MEVWTKSPEETKRLAEQLAAKMYPGLVLALYGDLGSGKTTFTGFLVKSLGSTSRVQSPTFVIARKYISEMGTINHLDLYRIKSKEELIDLDMAQFFMDSKAITIVEWPELVEDLLPTNTLRIKFDYVDENSRKIYVND